MKIKNTLIYLRLREFGLSFLHVFKRHTAAKKMYHSLEVRYDEILRLKNLPFKYNTTTSIFGHDFEITSPFWYLHGLKEIFEEKQYEFKTHKESPYIIDCGANIGLSVLFFKKKYPGSKILAFEADPQIFEKLRTNCSCQKLDDIQLENKAVWIENSKINFIGDNLVGGKITSNINNDIVGINSQVQAIRLRDFLYKEVDFLKIDIEGAEIDVLNDCKDVLCNVKNIFIEYHSPKNSPQDLNELLLILKENNFRYYMKEAWVTKKFPFLENCVRPYFDLQLNIFGTKEPYK